MRVATAATTSPRSRMARWGRAAAGFVGVGISAAVVPCALLMSPAVTHAPAQIVADRLHADGPLPTVVAPPLQESHEGVGGGTALPGSVPVVTLLPPERDKLLGYPVESHLVTSPFGVRIDPLNGRVLLHTGTDFGEACGGDVHAAEDGVVKNAGEAGDYGNRVVLTHEDRDGKSFATTYNHMSAITVTAGQHVKRGDIVGKVGTTGHSTGCHMHFEVVVAGAYTDPLPYLTGEPSTANMTVPVGEYMPTAVSTPPSSATPTHAPEPTQPVAPAPAPSSTAPATRAPEPSAPPVSEPPATTAPAPSAPESGAPAPSAPTTAPPATEPPSTEPTTDPSEPGPTTKPTQPPATTDPSAPGSTAPGTTEPAPVAVGIVFVDTNGDGVMGAGEVAVSKPLSLILTPAAGGKAIPVEIAADGSFALKNIPDGTYVVTLPPASGYALTPAGAKVTVVVAGGKSSNAVIGVK